MLAWLLEIAFVWKVSIRVCVHPQAINLNKHQTSHTAFQFLYMTLAINITDECGLSNEAIVMSLCSHDLFVMSLNTMQYIE